MSKLKLYRPVAAVIRITSPYGMRIDPVTKADVSFHYGIDFGTPEGTPVVAATGGTIEAVGYENPLDHKQGFGLRVRQLGNQDGHAFYVYYGHLSETAVEAGQCVEAGTRIGLSGNTGKSTGPHLHLEARPIGGKGVPIDFFQS